MTYTQYRRSTFKELILLSRAKSDWAAIQAGKNPFLTREQAKADIEYLRSIAAEYGKK